MRPGMRLGLALGRARFGRLLALRRRNAGIVRRLRRQPQLRLELRHSPRQPRVRRHQLLDPRQQRRDQSVLVGQITRRSHL